MDGDLVSSHPAGCLGDNHPGTVLEGVWIAVSVPQSLLLLMSKLSQIKGYSEGMQEGFTIANPETLDAAILAEHMEKGMTHLCKLIDEACSIEQDLRQKLRQQGESL